MVTNLSSQIRLIITLFSRCLSAKFGVRGANMRLKHASAASLTKRMNYPTLNSFSLACLPSAPSVFFIQLRLQLLIPTIASCRAHLEYRLTLSYRRCRPYLNFLRTSRDGFTVGLNAAFIAVLFAPRLLRLSFACLAASLCIHNSSQSLC